MGANPPPEPHPALQYLLDPPAFLALSGNERRDFLFKLMAVSLAPTAVMDALEKRGHDPALLKLIAPQLRQGFTVAHTEAQGIARGLKGQYREVTGENYGEVKAESWAAEAPAVPAEGAEKLQGELAALEANIGQAQAEFGAVRARAEERERLAERLTRTQTDAGHMEEYKAIEQAVRQQLDKLAAEERGLTDELREAEGKATLASHIPQGAFHPCPVCGASLVYDRGQLKPGRPPTKQDMEALAAAERGLASRRQALEIVKGTRKTTESELRHASEALGRAKNAKEMLASFEAIDERPPESADAMLGRLAVLTTRRDELCAEIQSIKRAREAVAECDAKTKRARALHEEIKALIALIADLAPDGLPAELLEKAMGPINARLQDSAAMTGWPLIVIDTDEIWLSGIASRRPLSLASDSERWRATAMIAEAIAHLSGLKIMCLDGMDILDAPSRAQ